MHYRRANRQKQSRAPLDGPPVLRSLCSLLWKAFLASPPHLQKSNTESAAKFRDPAQWFSWKDLNETECDITSVLSMTYESHRGLRSRTTRTLRKKISWPIRQLRSGRLWAACPCRSFHESPAAKWRDRWPRAVRTASC